MPTPAAATLLLLLGGAASEKLTVDTEAIGEALNMVVKNLGNSLGVVLGEAIVQGGAEEGQGGRCKANEEILDVQKRVHNQFILLQRDIEKEPWSEDRDGILAALELLDRTNQKEAQSVAGGSRCREMSRDLRWSASVLSSPGKAMEFRNALGMLLKSSAKKVRGTDYQLNGDLGQAIAEPIYKMLAGPTADDGEVGEDYFFGGLFGMIGPMIGALPGIISTVQQVIGIFGAIQGLMSG
jgi:hypothetical protein